MVLRRKTRSRISFALLSNQQHHHHTKRYDHYTNLRSWSGCWSSVISARADFLVRRIWFGGAVRLCDRIHRRNQCHRSCCPFATVVNVNGVWFYRGCPGHDLRYTNVPLTSGLRRVLVSLNQRNLDVFWFGVLLIKILRSWKLIPEVTIFYNITNALILDFMCNEQMCYGIHIESLPEYHITNVIQTATNKKLSYLQANSCNHDYRRDKSWIPTHFCLIIITIK